MDMKSFPYSPESIGFFNAIKQGDAIKVLQDIEGGMPVNCFDDADLNPIYHAVLANHPKIVTLLISHGANPNGCNKNGRTPLSIAIEGSNKTLFKILLEAGANPKICDGGNTLAHLWLNSALCKQESSTSYTPIELDVVKSLVHHGMPIDHRGLGGNTLLMSAVRCGRGDLIEGLLGLGADLFATNNEGNQAIHLFSERDSCVKISFFVKQGANINAKNWRGETPLHFHVKSHVIEEIIALGGNVHAQNNDGDTPLMICIKDARTGPDFSRSLDLLLCSGADPDGANYFGETPRSFASKNKKEPKYTAVLAQFSAHTAKSTMLSVSKRSKVSAANS